MLANEIKGCFILGIWLLLILNKRGKAQPTVSENDVCLTPACEKSSQMLQENMDTSMDPCFDFYQFACGNYKRHNPIPAGKNIMNSFTIREEEINRKLLDHLRSSSEHDYPGIRKARAFFLSCMNEGAIEALGDIPIPAELNKVGLPIKPPFNRMASTLNDYGRILAKMRRYVNVSFLFSNIDVIPDPAEKETNRVVIRSTPTTKNNIYINIENPVRNHHWQCYESSAGSNPKDDEESIAEKNYKQILKEYMVNVLNYMYRSTYTKFSNMTTSIISIRADKVINFLLKLEKIRKRKYQSYEMEEEPFTVRELQEITNEILQKSKIRFNWLNFLETLFEDIGEVRDIFVKKDFILVENIEQLEDTLELISTQDEEVLESTLWWLVTKEVITFSTKELRDLQQEFRKKISNTGTVASREKTCILSVRAVFNHALAHLIVTESHSEYDKQQIIEMAENIKTSFKENIMRSSWLDGSTKMAALNKLESIDTFISYEKWLADPKAVELFYENSVILEDSYYLSVMNFYNQQIANQLALYFKKNNDNPDGSKQPKLSPLTMNAVYDRMLNIIDVPIGILGFPHTGHGLQCLNYGGIGAIIGHELVHGFDNEGKDYDTFGDVTNWWKQETVNDFEKRAKCFVIAYNQFYHEDVKLHVDGQITLAENIADSGGFRQALHGYRLHVEKHGVESKLPAFEHLRSEQLLTLALANVWCENTKPKFHEIMIKTKEHAPGSSRVNGIFMNSKEFAEIWQCSENDKMNPSSKCYIW